HPRADRRSHPRAVAGGDRRGGSRRGDRRPAEPRHRRTKGRRVKFGPVPVDAAAGAILAHSLPFPRGGLPNGTILRDRETRKLREAGLTEVVAARLDPADVHEDAAAGRLAEAVAGDHVRIEAPFTGRSNLYSDASGLLVVDRAMVDRLNRIDPAITVAT